jgi:Fur family ferric uptake transcriptional regulator
MCRGFVLTTKPFAAEVFLQERQHLRQVLREQGYAVTAPRMAIYDILLQANGHLCAGHALEVLAQVHPTWHVNKTTMYRTLDLFQALGLVHEMKRDDGSAEYELASRGRHGHLLCRGCGEMCDIDQAIAASLQRELRDRAGFAVELAGHALVGLCRQCVAAAN